MKDKFSYTIANEEYYVQVQVKKNKNIYLKIIGDHELMITVPKYINMVQILQFLKMKETWIKKHPYICKEEKIISINDKYLVIFGEKRPFVLKQAERRMILPKQDGFEIYLPQLIQKEFDLVLNNFYQYRILTEVIYLRKKYDFMINGYSKPTFYVSKMKSKWGSFSLQTNRIHLNQQLIFYPLATLEAVVAHEFAHILVHNHSLQFYKLLFSWLPDYKDRIACLKNFEKMIN